MYLKLFFQLFFLHNHGGIGIKVGLLLIALGIQSSASGQEKARLHLTVGPQFSQHILQDEGMSLSRYAGLHSGALLALEKRKNQGFSRMTWMAGTGDIKAAGRQGARVNRAEQNFFEANYLYLKDLWAVNESQSNLQLGLMAGGVILSRYNQRLGNSARSYDGLLYLGPALGYSGTWDWSQKSLPWRLHAGLPILAGVVRPSLTNLRDFFDPQIPDLQSRWDQHGWTSIGSSFSMLKSGAEIIYPISDARQIRLNYHWEFFNYTKVNQVQSSMHQLSVCYAFSLK
jgi:hypothetical protein